MNRRYQAARGKKKRELEQAREELGSLPAWLATKLPMPARITLQNTETHQIFEWELGESTRPVEDTHRRAFLLHAAEVDAVIRGVEAQRMFPADLVAFALRKLHEPAFRVTHAHALAGASEEREVRHHWSLGEVLHALELEVVDISLDTDKVSLPARVAA
jgi:hypothetical protein